MLAEILELMLNFEKILIRIKIIIIVIIPDNQKNKVAKKLNIAKISFENGSKL